MTSTRTSARTLLLVGRVQVRRVRSAVRTYRHAAGLPVRPPGPRDGIAITHTRARDALSWRRLVRTSADRPPAAGLLASPLGSAPSALHWVWRLLSLRLTAPQSVRSYLVRVDGVPAGEALARLDLGTSTVDVVVWSGAQESRQSDVVALLAEHLLASDAVTSDVVTSDVVTNDVVRRVVCTTATELAAIDSPTIGSERAGVLHDPPWGDRVVTVVTRQTGQASRRQAASQIIHS